MSRENVEIVRRVFDGFNRGDVGPLESVMAADGRLVPLRADLEGTVHVGPEGVRQFWTDAMEAWSGLRVEIDEFRDLEDGVLVVGWLTGSARGTGANVETRAGWVVRFRAEEAAELRTYASEAAALEAVGLGE